jgi:hypothetical protein
MSAAALSSVSAAVIADPGKYAESLKLAMESAKNIVQLAKEFLDEVFPFEAFKKISDGITRELNEYSEETMKTAAQCSTALRQAANTYRDAVLPVRAFCVTAITMVDAFLKVDDVKGVPLLLHATEEGIRLCQEALVLLKKARDEDLSKAISATILLGAKLDRDSKPDSDWFLKKQEAINNVANRKWFVLLASLGGVVGIALFEAFAAPQIQGDVDRLTTQLNAAVAKLKGYSEQIKATQEKCTASSNLISKEMARITDLQGGLKSSQIMFKLGDLIFIKDAAVNLKTVCGKFLKEEGLNL